MKNIFTGGILSLALLSPLAAFASTCDYSEIYIDNQTGEELKLLVDPYSGHFVYPWSDDNISKGKTIVDVPVGNNLVGKLKSSPFTGGNAHANLYLHKKDETENSIYTKVHFITDGRLGIGTCFSDISINGNTGTWKKPNVSASNGTNKSTAAKVTIGPVS